MVDIHDYLKHFCDANCKANGTFAGVGQREEHPYRQLGARVRKSCSIVKLGEAKLLAQG